MKKSWKNHSGEIVNSKEDFDVIDCESCLFKHIIPLIDAKELDQYYQEEFYLNADHYIKHHTEDIEWGEIEYNEKYDIFDQQISKKNKRILDIGSGPGYFLKTGVERGWDVLGFEPGRPAYEFSSQELNLNIINQPFSYENYKNFGCFDIIHLNKVLEHITNPRQLLSFSFEILNPSGLISVSVPNDFNPLQEIACNYLDKEPWWVVPKDHINYFNFNSLSRLMNSIGLEVIYRTSNFPIELFLLMGDDYIGNNKLGREIHAKRKNFDIAMAKTKKTKFKREIYNQLADIGLGREITVIGKKIIPK